MSCAIATNQTTLCNCRQASYEYEFIIVQLQTDCISFITLFLSSSLPPQPLPSPPYTPPNWPAPVTGIKSLGNQVMRPQRSVFAVTVSFG